MALTNQSRAQIELGVYGGGDLSNISGDRPPGGGLYLPEWGYLVGLTMDLKIGEDVFLSFQPGYNSHGGKIQYPDTSGVWVDSLDIDLRTVMFPVLVKVVSNNQKFHFTTGLIFGFSLNAKISNGLTTKSLEEIQTFNPSVIFGVGYRIPMKTGKFSINFRYTQGLVNITDARKDPNSPVPRIKSTGYHLIGIFDIPIGKQ